MYLVDGIYNDHWISFQEYYHTYGMQYVLVKLN